MNENLRSSVVPKPSKTKLDGIVKKVQIHKIKRVHKRTSTKEKILAALGVGSGLLGVSGVAAPRANTTQVVGVQSSESGKIKAQVEEEIQKYFGAQTTRADFNLTSQNASSTTYDPTTVSASDMDGIQADLVNMIQSGQASTINGDSVTAYMLGWGGATAGASQTVLGQTYNFDGSNWQLESAAPAANTTTTSPAAPSSNAVQQSVAPRGPQEGDTRFTDGSGNPSPSGIFEQTFYQGNWVFNNGQTADGSQIGQLSGISYGSEGNQWIILDNQTIDGSKIGQTAGTTYISSGGQWVVKQANVAVPNIGDVETGADGFKYVYSNAQYATGAWTLVDGQTDQGSALNGIYNISSFTAGNNYTVVNGAWVNQGPAQAPTQNSTTAPSTSTSPSTTTTTLPSANANSSLPVGPSINSLSPQPATPDPSSYGNTAADVQKAYTNQDNKITNWAISNTSIVQNWYLGAVNSSQWSNSNYRQQVVTIYNTLNQYIKDTQGALITTNQGAEAVQLAQLSGSSKIITWDNASTTIYDASISSGQMQAINYDLATHLTTQNANMQIQTVMSGSVTAYMLGWGTTGTVGEVRTVGGSGTMWGTSNNYIFDGANWQLQTSSTIAKSTSQLGGNLASFVLTVQNASSTTYDPVLISSTSMNTVHNSLVAAIQNGSVPIIGGSSVTAYMLGWGGATAGTSQTVLGQTYNFDGVNWDLQISAAAPTLTSTQGYNDKTQTYEATANTVSAADTYLILYGNFAASGNTVTITGGGTTETITSANGLLETAGQLNVPLPANLAPGSYSVTVSNSGGTSGSVSFSFAVPSAAKTTKTNAQTTSAPIKLSVDPNTVTIASQGLTPIGAPVTMSDAGPSYVNGGIVNSYSVQYYFMPDGEVEAQFSYNGNYPYNKSDSSNRDYHNSTIVIRNGQIGELQSDGSIQIITSSSPDLAATSPLFYITSGIMQNAPASRSIVSGVTFSTPLNAPAGVYGMSSNGLVNLVYSSSGQLVMITQYQYNNGQIAPPGTIVWLNFGGMSVSATVGANNQPYYILNSAGLPAGMELILTNVTVQTDGNGVATSLTGVPNLYSTSQVSAANFNLSSGSNSTPVTFAVGAQAAAAATNTVSAGSLVLLSLGNSGYLIISNGQVAGAATSQAQINAYQYVISNNLTNVQVVATSDGLYKVVVGGGSTQQQTFFDQNGKVSSGNPYAVLTDMEDGVRVLTGLDGSISVAYGSADSTKALSLSSPTITKDSNGNIISVVGSDSSGNQVTLERVGNYWAAVGPDGSANIYGDDGSLDMSLAGASISGSQITGLSASGTSVTLGIAAPDDSATINATDVTLTKVSDPSSGDEYAVTDKGGQFLGTVDDSGYNAWTYAQQNNLSNVGVFEVGNGMSGIAYKDKTGNNESEFFDTTAPYPITAGVINFPGATNQELLNAYNANPPYPYYDYGSVNYIGGNLFIGGDVLANQVGNSFYSSLGVDPTQASGGFFLSSNSLDNWLKNINAKGLPADQSAYNVMVSSGMLAGTPGNYQWTNLYNQTMSTSGGGFVFGSPLAIPHELVHLDNFNNPQALQDWFNGLDPSSPTTEQKIEGLLSFIGSGYDWANPSTAGGSNYESFMTELAAYSASSPEAKGMSIFSLPAGQVPTAQNVDQLVQQLQDFYTQDMASGGTLNGNKVQLSLQTYNDNTAFGSIASGALTWTDAQGNQQSRSFAIVLPPGSNIAASTSGSDFAQNFIFSVPSADGQSEIVYQNGMAFSMQQDTNTGLFKLNSVTAGGTTFSSPTYTVSVPGYGLVTVQNGQGVDANGNIVPWDAVVSGTPVNIQDNSAYISLSNNTVAKGTKSYDLNTQQLTETYVDPTTLLSSKIVINSDGTTLSFVQSSNVNSGKQNIFYDELDAQGNPTGTIVTQYADGSQVWERPDGTTVIVGPDGTVAYLIDNKGYASTSFQSKQDADAAAGAAANDASVVVAMNSHLLYNSSSVNSMLYDWKGSGGNLADFVADQGSNTTSTQVGADVVSLKINNFANDSTIHITQGVPFTIPTATVTYDDGTTATVQGQGSVDVDVPSASSTDVATITYFTAGYPAVHLYILVDPSDPTNNDDTAGAHIAKNTSTFGVLTAQSASNTAYDSTVTPAQMSGIQAALISQVSLGQVSEIDGDSVTAYMYGVGVGGSYSAGQQQVFSGQTYVYDGANWQLQTTAQTSTNGTQTAGPNIAMPNATQTPSAPSTGSNSQTTITQPTVPNQVTPQQPTVTPATNLIPQTSTQPQTTPSQTTPTQSPAANNSTSNTPVTTPSQTPVVTPVPQAPQTSPVNTPVSPVPGATLLTMPVTQTPTPPAQFVPSSLLTLNQLAPSQTDATGQGGLTLDDLITPPAAFDGMSITWSGNTGSGVDSNGAAYVFTFDPSTGLVGESPVAQQAQQNSQQQQQSQQQAQDQADQQAAQQQQAAAQSQQQQQQTQQAQQAAMAQIANQGASQQSQQNQQSQQDEQQYLGAQQQMSLGQATQQQGADQAAQQVQDQQAEQDQEQQADQQSQQSQQNFQQQQQQEQGQQDQQSAMAQAANQVSDQIQQSQQMAQQQAQAQYQNQQQQNQQSQQQDQNDQQAQGQAEQDQQSQQQQSESAQDNNADTQATTDVAASPSQDATPAPAPAPAPAPQAQSDQSSSPAPADDSGGGQ